MRRAEKMTALILTLGLLSVGCGASLSAAAPPDRATPEPTRFSSTAALAEFDSCDPFLDYVISHAVDLVGPYGLNGPDFWPWATRDMAGAEGGLAVTPSADGMSGHSGTNIQVEGVDEPDIVKSDGRRIVLVSEGDLIVVDVTGDDPVEVGRLDLDDLSVHSLFLSGDKVLLLGSVWMSTPLPLGAEADLGIAPVPGTPTVQMIEVDISADPEVIRTMTIDGAFISGRMVGDSVRLVVSSGPVGFEWKYPTGSGLRAEREAIEANREIIRQSTEENWIPYYVVTDEAGDVEDEGVLFDCERAAHPEEFSGLDMLSVVTVDLSNGLDVVDATGVLATGDTVYASEDSLYVATQDFQTWRWLETGDEADRPDGPTTQIHRFDTSSPDETHYAASGSVEGYLLNQFAMDEHEGMLRVASTTSPSWWGSGPESESRVTVLDQVGDDLIQIGLVDGLGETEQIYSVRFMGDVGYVVTFRQTDPLFTLDLSEPTAPRVIGELKIPGYSAYLHPVGDGLVLGVGQDATEDGQIRGTQVSLFDVTDLNDPIRLDSYSLSEGTSSQVEYDHHAFLFWEGLAMIPVQQWSWDGKGQSGFMGAVGLRVDDDGHLSELSRVVHPGGEDQNWDGRSQILRSVVVDDAVYTISPKGMMKSSLDSLDEIAWLDF